MTFSVLPSMLHLNSIADISTLFWVRVKRRYSFRYSSISDGEILATGYLATIAYNRTDNLHNFLAFKSPINTCKIVSCANTFSDRCCPSSPIVMDCAKATACS